MDLLKEIFTYIYSVFCCVSMGISHVRLDRCGFSMSKCVRALQKWTTIGVAVGGGIGGIVEVRVEHTLAKCLNDVHPIVDEKINLQKVCGRDRACFHRGLLSVRVKSSFSNKYDSNNGCKDM